MKPPTSSSRETNARSKGGGESKVARPKETDPLLSQASPGSYSRAADSSNIRSRRSSRSPTSSINQHFGSSSDRDMNAAYNADSPDQEIHKSYNIIPDDTSRSGNASLNSNSRESLNSSQSQSTNSRSIHQRQRHYVAPKESGDNPPLLEIPEEIYDVRKSALQVLKPLTRTWFIMSIGFALSVLFGMAKWTGLLLGLPYWFILLPSWLAHVGLFWCHILAAKALSVFIAGANDSRQRPDSRDHLDRTEYLPLLQRSLKFGLKTGLISFTIFIFEILVYFRLSKGKLSLATTFVPLWIMVFGGAIDGIICRTQHFLRLICWIFIFAAMMMACLKVDAGMDGIRWRMVISPIVAVLSVASATLIYIIYGHQIGYYRLTEAQLTAGNLYSLAALISIVLVVVVGEVMPLSRPVEIETRVFVVLMAPLVVTLVGMGGWVVSRDEFGRLLLYGGQAAIHPRKLRWERNGWTCVQGQGVTTIPMFGEVNFSPLERSAETNNIEMCSCCSCYPYEEDVEDLVDYVDDVNGHPYLAPKAPSDQPSQQAYSQWQQNATSNTQIL